MSWAAVAGAAIGVVGGAMNGSNSSSQTTQQTIDPRIANLLYGSGSGGLLGGVNNLYQQQASQGGLNPLQISGLEMQRQALMDPRYTQGFDQMRNLGSGLLGQGVAGNPFTGGLMAMGNVSPPPKMTTLPVPQGGLMSAAMQPIQAQQIAPPAPAVSAPASTGPAPGSWEWQQQLNNEVLAGK